jgi:Uncharacterized conserved protein
MAIVNVDLHVHSRYSRAVSKNMNLSVMAEGAKKKGIDVLATGDCLHKRWLQEIRGMQEENGLFLSNGVRFVLTTEVEDLNRVHHLLIFPSIESVEMVRKRFEKFSDIIDVDGRPKLRCNGSRIAEVAEDANVLIGPAHAFTPWTAMYAYFDSLRSCYGEFSEYVSFVELGLSADSDYADRIEELERLTFLTNSDAHSAQPVRLAREFNRMELNSLTFESIKEGILRKNGNRIVLNVGLPPQEGKYNESACISCFKHYTLEESKANRWRCSCGGIIKKGVRDRVEEISDFLQPRHPEHRPPYLHLVPLAEIIAKGLSVTVQTKKVFEEWNNLVCRFGSEINVLADVKMGQIREVTRREVADAIEAFREGNIRIRPGGGGRYGEIEIEKPKKKLLDF